MYEKLLAILPYNPALANQMAFYSRRMREEAAIRRIGLIFIVLAFFIQFFAVLSPPQATSAASNNDLINGGVHAHGSVTAANDAGDNCHNNTQGYKDILATYGIGCGDVGKGELLTIHASGQDYYSMGRIPYGKGNEKAVKIGGTKLYWRQLTSFGDATYEALRVRNDAGKAFYIILDCGNLVSVGLPPTETAAFIPETVTLPAPTPAPAPVSTPAPAPTPVAPATPTPTPTPAPNNKTPAKCPLDTTILRTDARCKACEYNVSILADNTSCKPCDQSKSSQDTASCITIHKTAANVTANIPDANGTMAAANDVITYTLYAQNNSKAVAKNYIFQENIRDVLDYANITDTHGGAVTSDNLLTWPAVNIEAGKTASVQVTIKVKDPVPQTPVSASDPGHFDLVMTNVYGNTVNIKLPPSPSKQVETVAATLPNTGPGTSLFITASIVIIAGYFYGRSRLLSQESEIAIRELTTSA